ncbi:MAG: hypothetical protein J6M95_00230 [Bacilli bacterium]|nr:hypothetical protein [Bacilli bacterium]
MKNQRAKYNNEEERNGKKRLIVLIILFFVILLGGTATAVIIPYIKTLPVYKSFKVTYNASMITDSSVLESDLSFKLTTTNSLNNQETLSFSTTNTSVSLGPVSTHPYIYAAKGEENSNVTLKFTVDTALEIKDIYFDIFKSNAEGNVITELTDAEFQTNNNEAHYESSSNIYINTVVVTYKLRVKN